MPVVSGVGNAAGISTVFADSQNESAGNPFAGVGSAAGVATVTGRSADSGVGASAGVATVSGVGSSLSDRGAGTAAGIATVVGASQGVVTRQTENPKTYLLRIRDARIGANGIVELDFVREDLSIYPGSTESQFLSSGSLGGSPAPPPPEDNNSDNSSPGSTTLLLLDIPQLLGDQDGPGFYAAATGINDGWTGALLYEKKGSEFVQIAELAARAAIGRADTRLLSGSVTLFNGSGRTYVYDDTNTVDVTLHDNISALESVSEADQEAGVNAAAIGFHGRWEIISFGVATQLSARKWRLSHLLRGLKGTEWAVGTHQSGDSFVVLDQSLRRVSDAYGDLDVQRTFRASSIGSTIDSASNRKFTDNGVSLKPLAPVYLRGEEDADGNRALRWYRRSRLDGLAGRDAYDPEPPLGETTEHYEVDILDSTGATVVRTISSTIEAVRYSAAQQTADHGSVPSSLKIVVYQLSETRGRGYGAAATISLFDAMTPVTVTPGDSIYDIYVYAPGRQPDGRRILVAPLLRAVVLPAGLPLSRGVCPDDSLPTAETIYSLQKNGVEFGTATFDAAAEVAVLDSADDVFIDPTVDVLEIVVPSPRDPTIADVGLALAGVRV
jgi:hypothetical protein